MAENRDERIRQRAYEIWEEEGRPEGRHEEHWRRAAEEELARENAGSGAGARTTEAEKPPAQRPKPAGKGDPHKTAAEHHAGEETEASSGRAAGAATRQNAPGNVPADNRAAENAARAPGKAAPRAKPRKSDAAVKSANERANSTPRPR